MKKVNTNPRYRGFNQTHFTAGDEDQFMKSRDYSDSRELKLPLHKQLELNDNSIWDGYRNLSGEDITNTFRYIFHKFKKGLYVRIKDNKLVTFLPFSKAKFINEWGDRIKTEGSMIDFLKHVSELDGRPFCEKYVNKFTNGWYANNCLVRYEFPLSEGDTGTPHIRDLLEQLCENRELPDIEFFINRRDFPLLKRDGTEPYDHIWDDDKKPLVSHKYERYVPVLSCVERDGFADIAMPTIDDWARIRNADGVTFPKSPENWNYDFSKPWEDRKPTAVFRGSSTGVGVTVETNPRLKVAYLSKISEPDTDGIPLLDAGITEWKVRPRKIKGEKFLKTIEVPNLPFTKISKLSPEQQADYKYIINIDGHVSAFRLSLEMNMGCVILLVESDYRVWFSKYLHEYIHYVPVKRDLSDLIDKIKWCKSHDLECRQMVENCREFYKRNLSKDGVFNSMQTLLLKLKNAMGNYTYSESPLKRQYREETEWLKTQKIKRKIGELKEVDLGTNYPRFYNRFRAIHLTDFRYHLKYEKRLSQTPLSIVGSCTVDKFPIKFAVKTTKDTDKLMENTHEAYLGINAINRLLQSVPNFIYTFGPTLAGDLVSEFVEGTTMFDWLRSRDFSFPVYLDILLQLSLALEVAQQECGFVHYDLFPWNIILERQPVERTFEYIVGLGKVVSAKTRLVPIIIDYGKSHAYVNDKHSGFINMFTMSTVQDIMSIVLSSASVVFKDTRISKQDEKVLISLVEFVTMENSLTYSQAKRISTEASFSCLISSDKGESERLRPIDFFNRFKSRNFSYSNRAKYVFNIGRVQSFFGVGDSYRVPNLENDMIKTLYFFRRLLNTYRGRVPKSLIMLRKKMGDNCYWPDITIPDITNISETRISEETFHNKEKCAAIYNGLPSIGSDIIEYLEMIRYLLVFEELTGVDAIRSRYKDLPETWEFIRSCIANKNVLSN